MDPPSSLFPNFLVFAAEFSQHHRPWKQLQGQIDVGWHWILWTVQSAVLGICQSWIKNDASQLRSNSGRLFLGLGLWVPSRVHSDRSTAPVSLITMTGCNAFPDNTTANNVKNTYSLWYVVPFKIYGVETVDPFCPMASMESLSWGDRMGRRPWLLLGTDLQWQSQALSYQP